MAVTFFTKKLHLEAGAWLARLQATDRTPEDEAQFQLWLTADAAHAAAFEAATNIWDQLGAIPREVYVPKQDAKIHLSRRMMLIGVAGAAVFGTSLPFLTSAYANTYQTAVGEQKRVPLADGDSLFLDTNTCVSVNWTGNQCLVNLKYGRVSCRVGSRSYPLRLQVADRFVAGTHCVFDVSSHSALFSVTLINGDADVKSSDSGSVHLRPGDRISSTSGNRYLHHDRPNLALLVAWQTGRLVFRDDTVSTAVEDVNRYSTTKIEIDDPTIASLRISGGYIIGDPVGFADSLSQLLPVQVRQAAGKIELTRRREI